MRRSRAGADGIGGTWPNRSIWISQRSSRRVAAVPADVSRRTISRPRSRCSGAMMLSREAITAAVEARLEPGDFYKPAHSAIYEAVFASAQPGRARRPGHRCRGAAAHVAARPARRAADVDAHPGVDARFRERRPLRADRCRARDAAPVDRDGGRHPRDGVLGRRRSRRDARSRGGRDLRGRREARCRDTCPALSRTRADDEPARGVVRPRERHRRHRDRIPRSRRDPLGPPTVDAVDRRRPSRTGEDVVRARSGPARRDPRPQAGDVLLHGDGLPRAHEAPARSRGTRAVAQATDRQARRAGMAASEPGRRPTRRSRILHRRQSALHGDGDAREGSSHQSALWRPRADRGRLPAADDIAQQAHREPSDRGVGALARTQDPCPRARSARGVLVAAEPSARIPPGQAADARRPARVRMPHSRHARSRSPTARGRRSATCTIATRTTSTC